MPNTNNVFTPNPKMLIVVGLYLVAMVILGFLSSKKENKAYPDNHWRLGREGLCCKSASAFPVGSG